MRPLIRIGFLACTLVLPAASFAGTNLIYAGSQGGGAHWDLNIWQTNNGTGVGAGTAVGPTIPGNTYTTRSNATAFGNNTGSGRIRNNLTNVGNTITFNGDSLTLTTNTEIRAKNITQPAAITGPVLNFPGVGGNPGLILSGGILNAGDDGVYKLDGKIQVANQSYICPGDNGGGGTLRPNRGFTFLGQLSGAGTMVIFQGTETTPQTISGVGNTFSGQWIIKAGRLVGTTANSLGTNSITCNPNFVLPVPPFSSATPIVDIAGPAVLEPSYNLNSAGVLTLINGGRLTLHQEVCFSSVVIEGIPLSAGIHYFPELVANFPNNFTAGGSGALVVQPYGTPPPLPPSILTQPMPQKAYPNSTTRFVVGAADNGFPPLTYQWRRDGTNLSNGGTISGANTNTLLLSNVSSTDAGPAYDVIVANASFSVTSSVVTLSLVPTNNGAYEAAVLADGPLAFYQMNETADPSAGTAEAFDYVNGYFGTYGAGAQNGFNSILGPASTDGFPGFLTGNNAGAFFLPGFGPAGASRLTVTPWNLNGNNVTLTAWINPNGLQNPNEGIIFCRGGTTTAGLNYSPLGQLGYTWNNESDTYTWPSGLTPPPNQWSFVALVVTPFNATIYLLNSSGLAAATHPYNHVVQGFEGTTLIGDDSFDAGNNTRSFNGNIDDVAIFNQPLSSGQIVALYSAASGIANFAPAIAVPPQSTNMFQGQTAQFTALAVGSPTLAYQWQAGAVGSGVYTNLTDGGQFSGTTTPTLTVSGLDIPNNGDYIMWVTNLLGAATSTPPATLTVQVTNPPTVITISVQEAAGADWDIGANLPGGNTNWSDFNPASYSAAAFPGSTYKVLAGARLRSPDGPVTSVFPGAILEVDGDAVWNVNPAAGATIGEIRFKQHTYPPVNGTVIIPHLVLNGGQLDVGNDNVLLLGGHIDILTNAPFNNDATSDRGYRVDAQLNGSGSIEYHGYNQAFTPSYSNSLNIACSSNTFSGSWNIVTGLLLGSATNGLGTNNIIIGTNGALQTSYPLRNTNANLVIFGKYYLTQTNLFRSVLINGASLAPGTYSFSTLNTTYSNNFPATWVAHNGGIGTAGAGSITVLSNAGPIITAQPQSLTLYGQQTAQFRVAALGNLPLAYQWMAGAAGSGTFTNLGDAGNISGSPTATLTVTNVTLANGADYLVTVSNLYGMVTSKVATLTVRPGPSITLQPVSQNLYMGQTAHFLVNTLGNLPLTYQWLAGVTGSGVFTNINNGGQFSGANSTNLNISALGNQNSLDYEFIVSNAGGSVTSTVVTLTVLQTNAAEYITLNFGGAPIQQASGNDWNTLNQWSDGLAASESSASKPGSTYDVIAGARLRSPAAAVSTNFPGLVLTNSGSGIFVNNNDATLGEIRFKHANPGTVFFKQLVMNGGQLDSGDNGPIILQGRIDILANAPIYADNAAGNDRPWQIDAWLTGNGSIEYHDFDATFNSVGGLNITGISNTFSGTWNVVQGALLGSALNCLGTNTITIGTNGAVETLYDLHNNNADLILDGKVFLHQNDVFRSVYINGVQLGQGTHPYTELMSAFPGNFPSTWNPQGASTVTTISGSITALIGPAPVVLSLTNSGGNIQLSWTQGTLLEATNLSGPWTINGAASPFTVIPTGPQKFFKLQVQ